MCMTVKVTETVRRARMVSSLYQLVATTKKQTNMKMTCSAAGGAGAWWRMAEHYSDTVVMLKKMIVFKDMVREWIMREEVNDGGGKKCGRGDEEYQNEERKMKMLVVVIMMISHLLLSPPHSSSSSPPYRGTLALALAPPMNSVASVTAGLRDDVGCIWARAAGSLSPFTAIGAESLSSPGPLHCAEPLHQSSLRSESEGKGRDLEMAPAPTPQTCASSWKLNCNPAAWINERQRRTSPLC